MPSWPQQNERQSPLRLWFLTVKQLLNVCSTTQSWRRCCTETKQTKLSKNYEDGKRERTGKPVQVDPGTLEAKKQLSSNLSPQAVEPPVQLTVPKLLQLLSATASLSLRQSLIISKLGLIFSNSHQIVPTIPRIRHAVGPF